MSEKSNILKAFNSHFFDFLDDIINIFPENKDLPVSKHSFDMIKRANPTAIIKAWYKFIYVPYFEIINRGEIEFFYEKDYNDDIGHLANSQSIMQIIDTLRQPVKDMSETNKAHTMKYLQNLSKLSEVYSGL
jgi:hypothetical protein